jgi:5-methylcytosine-specific restriction endonuclease McrA
MPTLTVLNARSAGRTAVKENSKAWQEAKAKRNPGGNQGVKCRPETRFAIYAMMDFKCVWCQRDMHSEDRNEIHLDHLIPKSDGGSNRPENLIVACANCNCTRANLPWENFARAKRGSARRVRNWIVKMNTVAGKQELKTTRRNVNSLMHLIIGQETPVKIASALK